MRDGSLSYMSLMWIVFSKEECYSARCCLTGAESVIVLLASKMSATEDN